MHFQKSESNRYRKVESVANITIFAKKVGGRHHFGFLQSVSSLVCPSFGDVGKL